VQSFCDTCDFCGNSHCVSVQLGYKAQYVFEIDYYTNVLPVVPVGLGSGVGSIASGSVHSSVTSFLIDQ
jgi:hypothetical protein